MDKLIEILNRVKPGIDYANEKNLFGDKLLDSLDIVMLIGEIDDEFDVEITPIDVVPENFKSADTIMALIERLENE